MSEHPADAPVDAPDDTTADITAEPTADGVADLLAVATGELDHAEDRPGQIEMAELVAAAIEDGHHVVVQAGTGTGKTLAYLVPAVAAGARTVVSTATKALQDQLANKDLPFLRDALQPQLAEVLGRPLEFAVLKGRSNYVCLQRLRELANPADTQLSIGDADAGIAGELGDMAATTQAEIKRIADWARTTETGDAAELDWSPSDNAWRAVSVGSDECPGADRCPLGDPCFAEAARRSAAAADVTVVNNHLYGLDVAADGAILPEHDLVVFDEAHVLEDVMSDTVGVQLAPGRFVAVSAVVRRIIENPTLVGGIAELAESLREVLSGRLGERLPSPLPEDLQDALTTARGRLASALEAIVAIDAPTEDVRQRQLRAQRSTARSIEQLDAAIQIRDGSVAFVSGAPSSPRLEVAPLDVGPTLRAGVWDRRTAVLTSATIPASLPHRLGLPEERVAVADVGSPFDYEHHALLYCALHLPNPNDAGFREAANDELAALITAAGGRTLALFTSWRAMDDAADALRDRLDVPILTQRDLPKPALVSTFAEDEATCLFATAGLFQGVDVPGRTLSLVVIDRIPFPRPDDPLLSARREQLGPTAFGEIDLPRASMLLAQAAGRLIRNSTDRGAVAVLDRRLGTARYRWDIVRALPPMRRTRHRDEAEAFLRDIVTPSL